MAKVTAGRMTSHVDGDFVVFLIGMRVNKLWKLHKWIPVAAAMGPMLRLLSKERDRGLMSFTSWVGPRGPLIVQYWRSVEQLEAFARDQSLPHRKAWQRFNQAVGDSGDVGIWHETFEVRDGHYEVLYGNMPQVGFATAGDYLPMRNSLRSSTQRRATNAGATDPVVDEPVSSESVVDEVR
jgi:fumigallin biosynthesis monooxygenase-like protein